MRLLALCFFAIALLTCATVRADDEEDYVQELMTFQGMLGSDRVIVDLAFPNQKGPVLGRYTLPRIGKDIPLHSVFDLNWKKDAGGTITIFEEAPCTPDTCESIVPDRDDQTFAFAPGKPSYTAKWVLKVDNNGIKVSGTRKELKTGESKTLSLAFLSSSKIVDDCCSTYDLLQASLSLEEFQKEETYDSLRFGVSFKKGPSKTLGNAIYHMETDERIKADFPVLDSLPENVDVTLANQWLFAARMALYSPDFACASRNYHGFRWNKTMAKKLENYNTKSKANIDFISGKLLGIAETVDVDCGDSWPEKSRAYFLGDVKTGKTVDVRTLLSGFQFQDWRGNPVKTGDIHGQYQPKQEFIDQLANATSSSGAGSSGTCFNEDRKKNITAAFRGDNLAFTFNTPYVGAECYIDILTIPLAEAGDYLNDKGKAYFAEFLK